MSDGEEVFCFAPGSRLEARGVYIGGIEGASEYWWLRIRAGKREQLGEPTPIGGSIDPRSISRHHTLRLPRPHGLMVTLHLRVYIVTKDDIGCEFKVKCIPIRSDGYRGEVRRLV